MKEFSLQRKSPGNFSRTLARAGILVVPLIALLLLLLPTFRGWLVPVFLPLLRVESNTTESLRMLSDALTPRRVLLDRIAVLEAERDHVYLRAYNSQVLSDENRALKELLGRRVFEEVMLASVLSRPTKTAYDTFLIDLGEPEIAPGDIVLAHGGVGIGRVVEVHPQTALVSLFSSPGSETEALIGPNRIPVIARGQGGGSFLAEFPREEHVAEGDNVILPGITPYVFGVIESIEVTSADPFITVRFSNPVNLQTLTWVSVLTDTSEIPGFDFPAGTSTPSTN
jgi:cell shape-determining protein MreC